MNHVVLVEQEMFRSIPEGARFKAKFYSPSYAHMIESNPVDSPQDALRNLADKLDAADKRQAEINAIDGTED